MVDGWMRANDTRLELDWSEKAKSAGEALTLAGHVDSMTSSQFCCSAQRYEDQAVIGQYSGPSY